MHNITGRCTCGAIHFSATGAPKRVGVCHCLDCRKHHGALFYAAAIFEASNVTIAGETAAYKNRHTCPTCGSSVFARSDTEIEVHLGSLDNPNQFTPEYELWTIRRENWIAPIKGATQYARDRTG